MTWDTSTPLGSESILNGDNRIRELKTDIQTALRGNASDGTEAKFPGSDTANPVYRYRGLKGNTAARPAAGIVSGTNMVFYQASAPTGWTAVAVNDKFLRVVTSGGTGGSTGGTMAASTSLAHTHTTGDFTLTIAEMPAHSHTIATNAGAGTGGVANTGTPFNSNETTNSTGGGGAHNHGETGSAIAGAFAYADIIIATKD